LIDTDVARTGTGKFLPRSFNVIVNVTSTIFHYETRDGDNVAAFPSIDLSETVYF
jgi:hypothetical protein